MRSLSVSIVRPYLPWVFALFVSAPAVAAPRHPLVLEESPSFEKMERSRKIRIRPPSNGWKKTRAQERANKRARAQHGFIGQRRIKKIR
jgi:hypothetical protein